MELIESIEDINKWLLREYGREDDGRARFRVVFSEGITEKRWIQHTDEGFELLSPEVREVPKYNQFKDVYILERLVPVGPESDLTEKISYEPAWVFYGPNDEPLPPRFAACKFIADSMYAAMNGEKTPRNYQDPDATPEQREAKLQEVMKQLFGNETAVGDALAHGYGVTVPSSYQKEETTH